MEGFAQYVAYALQMTADVSLGNKRVSMARESVLVDMVVHRLMQKSAIDYPLYEIIEQCMDTMDYDDSLSIDEVAEMLEHQIHEHFPVFKDGDSWEQHVMHDMLRKAERKMECLSKKAEKLKFRKESDEWLDDTDEGLKSDWNRVLMQVDKVNDRYRAMTPDARERLIGDGIGAESSK